MSYRILVINPGSTSTKIGVYEDETLLFDKTLRHSAEEIDKFDSIPAQKDWRRKLVMQALDDQGFDVTTLSAVSGRGGLLAPIRGGTYAVSDRLVRDCTVGVQGQHASNLGGLLAREIGDQLGIPSYIVDPVVVDELSDVARYAGHPLFHRTSIFHALNQKAVAKRYAKEHGRKYEDLNLIVCHMGGGCSIGAHVHGSVVDTQNALDGDGPFSPERSGSLPTGQLVSLCFSGKYTAGEVRKMLAGHGGLVAYTGSNDMRDLLEGRPQRRQGDRRCCGRLPLSDRQGDRRHGRGHEGPGGSDHPHRRHCLRQGDCGRHHRYGGLDRPHHRVSRRGRAAGSGPGRSARA